MWFDIEFLSLLGVADRSGARHIVDLGPASARAESKPADQISRLILGTLAETSSVGERDLSGAAQTSRVRLAERSATDMRD
jgi:hypothetical protein